MTGFGDELRTRALLSVQRALLGAVSHELRAVVVELQGSDINVTAIFDGEVSEEDAEALSCVAAEMTADFPKESVDVQCVRQDAPQTISATGFWVYQRRE